METSNNIPQIMYALISYGALDFRYEEIPVPKITEDEILVKVEACGICAGDIKSYQGAVSYWGDGKNIMPFNDAPCVVGHEFIGIVAAIGDNAKKKHGLKIGDRAIAEQIVPCGECRFCKEGNYWMCEKSIIHGHKKIVAEGGMADYIKYGSNDVVHRVSHSIPAEHAAMIEPLSCSVHTIERSNIQFNDVVVIAGMGPIGLSKLQLAKLRNPRMMIAIDGKPNRLELAKKLGADVTLNLNKCDVIKEVKNITDGYGCDVYIENSGHPSGVINGLQMIRKKGKFIEFSVFSEETTVDWTTIGDRKELDIIGSHISGLNGYAVAIDMLEKKIIKVDDIVTHTFFLKEWKQAFEIANKGDDSIKVVLIP
jgi:L-iditol 2-dehydrogenase